MPNLPISSLPELAASALTINAEFAVAQAGTTYKIKNGNLSPFSPVYGLFSQTSNSSTATTTSEVSIIGSGVGTLSVPANAFLLGDSFVAIFGGKVSNANDDIKIIVSGSGGAVLADSGFFGFNETDSIWFLTIYFTITSVGGTGSASISTHGNFQIVKNSGVIGHAFQDLNSTSFDTTIPNTLDITVQFDNTRAGNYFYSDYFVLNKIF
jgi:hypothetical protein